MTGRNAASEPPTLAPHDHRFLELLAGGHSFEGFAALLGHGDAEVVRLHADRLLGTPGEEPPGNAPAADEQVDLAIERSSLGEGVAPDLRKHAPEAGVAAVLAYTRRRAYAQRARQLLATHATGRAAQEAAGAQAGGDRPGRGAGGRPGSRPPAAWPEYSLLGLLNPGTRAALSGLGRRREYAAGDVIVSQGDETSFVCILVNGLAKITAVSPDGAESLLAIRVAGEALTEFAMIDGRPRSATVTAATAAVVQTVSAAQFEAFLDGHADAHRALQRSLAGKLRAAVEGRIVVNGPVKIRLARLLLNLAHAYGYGVPGGTAIDVPLSQPELGSLIGASEVSVHKNLAEMKREGLIAVPEHRRYVVRDPAGLRRIAAGTDTPG